MRRPISKRVAHASVNAAEVKRGREVAEQLRELRELRCLARGQVAAAAVEALSQCSLPG